MPPDGGVELRPPSPGSCGPGGVQCVGMTARRLTCLVAETGRAGVPAAPAHSKPLGHSFIVIDRALGSLIHCRWSGSWRAGSQDAHERAPRGPFQALLGLRPQASPGPTCPLFQRTDSAPVPSLCPVPRVWGRAGSQGGAKTARPVDPDKALSTRPLPDAQSLAC